MKGTKEMGRTRITLLALLAGSCCVVATARSRQANPPTDHVVLTGMFKHFPAVHVSNGAVRGAASYRPLAKKVTIEWIYTVAGLTDGSLPDPGEASSVQEIAVPFWPTEVAPCGVNKLAVAGRTVRGKTKIQVLELEDVPTPAAYYNMAGELKIPKLNVPIESVSTVFLEDAETFGDISLIAPILGAPGHILFQAIGTGGLRMYDLDIDTEEYELVVAPSAEGAGDAMVVSELRAFLDMQCARHVSLGDLYWFYSPEGTEPTVMLLDEDTDGELDSFRILAVEDWTELYGDATNYVEGILRR